MSYNVVRPIPAAWVPAIVDYTAALRAGGSPQSTIDTRTSHLKRAARTIGVASPWMLTGEQLTQWAGRQDWSVETRRGYRQSLLGFYRWAIVSGRTGDNPASQLPKVSPAQPNPRPAPERIYESALRSAGDRERLMLRLAAECGMRRAEVSVVHSRDLVEDLAGWSLVVHGKGSRDRIVPLPDQLAAELRLYCPRGFAFPGNYGAGHLSPRWVGKLVTKLLPGEHTMHALRHRFATEAYAVDRDTFTVQELLGHASPATTRRYVRLPRENLRRTVVAVAANTKPSHAFAA